VSMFDNVSGGLQTWSCILVGVVIAGWVTLGLTADAFRRQWAQGLTRKKPSP
jgi:hypothetical protein